MVMVMDTQHIFPETWEKPEALTLNPHRALYDVQHPGLLDEHGVDIRDRVHCLLVLTGASKEQYERLMQSYLDGFWKESDGLTSPVWRGKLDFMGLEKHPAAVAHDRLYRIGFWRPTADRYMREDLTKLGFPKWKSWICWTAVRLFGWIPYRMHKRRRRRDPDYAKAPWTKQ